MKLPFAINRKVILAVIVTLTLGGGAIWLNGRHFDSLQSLPLIGAKPAQYSQQQITKMEEQRVDWHPHIAGYNQDWTSAVAIPAIHFTHPVVPETQVGKPVDGILGIKPSIDFEAVFISTTDLEIRHKDRFTSGESYEISLDPEHLDGVPKTLPKFRYLIRIIQQSVSLRDEGLVADNDVQDGMKLSGILTTTDDADNTVIEKILAAKQDDTDLAVTWRHGTNHEHMYIIKGVKRKPLLSQVKLTWDASPINVADKGTRDVDVPPIGEFKMTSVLAVTEPDTLIEVHFSDDLDKKQNLSGLVSLNNAYARVQVDGSVLKVYGSEKLHGEQQLHLESSIKSIKGIPLKEPVNEKVTFLEEYPGIRFVDTGRIMPKTDKLTIPVEAVAVNAVQVSAFEIFPNNVGQLMQEGNITGYNEYYNSAYLGRTIWTRKILLPKTASGGWQRYNLDVTDLMTTKRGSVIRLDLNILPQYSTYPCEKQLPEDTGERHANVPNELRKYYKSAGYYSNSDDDDEGEDDNSWQARERNSRNPCKLEYYTGYQNQALLHASHTFFSSDIGIMAKQGDGETITVLTTGLRDAKPLAGAEVTVFNMQQQPIGTAKTSGDGLVTIKPEGMPHYLKVTKGDDLNYLKVANNEALPTNQFNVGGVKTPKGIKGFFYGERDVWRPGDDIFLTFILQDRDKTLPKDYPVSLDFFDPRNGKFSSQTNNKPVGSFYSFKLHTNENSPTGNWRAIVKVGDHYFDQVVRVEAIVPNRLKMELDVPEEGLKLDGESFKTKLKAQWLTGASAASLKADVQVKLSRAKTTFDAYKDYSFDDISREFSQDPKNIFEGKLDENGEAEIESDFDISMPPPGMLRAAFTERVFETGGQYSTQYKSVSVYPFATWVGMHVPEGNRSYYGSLDKDGEHPFSFVAIDSKGKAITNHKIELSVYHMDWRWWWDERDERYSRYVNDDLHALKETASLVTDANGRAQWVFKGKNFEYGRHLIRACDADKTGIEQHCVSREVYLGWGYQDQNAASATTMMLSSDKEKYQVGDKAIIHLPTGPDRRVFVSVENGSAVLNSYWKDISGSENTFELPITETMAPNVYLFVSTFQPHQQHKNDLPMRTYGILPIIVDDPGTHINPVIHVAEKVKPESAMSVKVSEQNGKEMTYTLAVVDEGLLGISDYHTPDPHNAFYKREALGVNTWDLYDWVVGAYSTDLSRLLAIGGSDKEKDASGNKRAQRFPPIVSFIGPFKLAANATDEQKIQLPPYLGAVRVMVVAGSERAYGKAEQTVKVTQPLIIHPTLPRVLGPDEEVRLPVDVFVTEPPFGEVKVSVQTDDFFTVKNAEEKLSFSKAGEGMAYLALKVNQKVGMAKVTIQAQLGEQTVKQVVNIPVRTANLPSTRTEAKLLQPGESWNPALVPHGMPGTNKTSLFVSSVPELKLEERLRYLIEYPHGCIEQTTSSVFPQIYLPSLVDLSNDQRLEIERNVNAAMERLKTFQTVSGGFSYWPYQSEVSPWGSNYAGHFLVEAKAMGYQVPETLFRKWLDYQRRQSQNLSDNYYADDAYRLYTLALAGAADLGAMNRLRERLGRTNNAHGNVMERWILALAYEKAGQKAEAAELLEQAGRNVYQNENWYWTYGSDLRDRSVLLMLYYRLGLGEDAWKLASDMAADLSKGDWYSTQTTAWSLMAIANTFGAGGKSQGTNFALQNNGAAWQDTKSQKPIVKQELTAYEAGKFSVRNTSDHPLYVSVANRGVPPNTKEEADSKGLTLTVRFEDMKGDELDIDSLPMGQDFKAIVTVRNATDRELNNLAFTEVVPSGWQIRNTRLEGMDDNTKLEYIDIRDDRQLSYFSLSPRPHWYSHYYWWRHNWEIEETVTITLLLNASFAGKYYLPGWLAEPMYDGKIHASTAGKWIEVKASGK